MTRDEHAFSDILQQAVGLGPLPMAVTHPCSREALLGAVEAADHGIATPILVAPAARLAKLADELEVDLSRFELVDVPHSHAAAEQAVSLVRDGYADILMKGSLHTDEFMGEALARGTGIRTDRRISHVWIMKVETYPRYLFITDAAINIEPDLLTKRDICQNAIDLTQALGISQPKVAILAAVETINPAMRSTLDAAALCKMADRGQITGAILDGPLAFDNAISREAADSKGIVSPVAGDPDILLVPDLEAGNMLGKQLTYLAAAASAGIVMGARAPIVLTSRADDANGRLASAAVANLLAHKRRQSGQRT
ncbi:phosphate acetyltransferase [Chromobacterium sp. Panama]|uniref:phosphate acetyltransferase n=1 Tax=Chromobacterium sp. Panama TaxID=2161826 RepID=UPI000D3031FB|nr:phosphate acetyltransferase [Chromobacterium sp. Panama]PTU63838.1 phosphate acetyltransferase [Chromobacterium sp. Panama]